ncbi:hypothetical protein HMPREF0972_02586 [Actinomyces sp. oral taxon 848 str. F0332]|nr:hypothetical protein HMPREF0972_02586 [Actinomyces sp. oral taxon 848 str. F0332]
MNTQTIMERIFDPPTRRRLRRLFVFFIVVAVLAVVLLVYDWVRDADGADDPGSSGSTTTSSAADGLGGTSPSDRGRGGVVAALGEVVRYGRQKTVTVADRKYYCENVITQAQREGAVQCNPPKPGNNDWGYTIAEVTDVRIDGQTARVTWTSRNQYGALHQEHEDFVYQDGRWRWHRIDHSTGRTGK